MRRCTKCQKEKYSSDFWKDKSRKDGIHPWCKACMREKNQEGYRRRMACPEYRAMHNEKTKRWQRENPQVREDVYRRTHLKVNYGMTLEEFDALQKEQKNLCAICEMPSKDRYLAVDHNHSTGAIRGLLCTSCNAALGYMYDNPSLLRKAATYLEESQRAGADD